MRPSFAAVIIQIALLDIVFRWIRSLPPSAWSTPSASWLQRSAGHWRDDVSAAGPISAFVNRRSDGENPRAVVFTADRRLVDAARVSGMHIAKGYIYFAMGFSVFVEMINLRVRKSQRLSNCMSRTFERKLALSGLCTQVPRPGQMSEKAMFRQCAEKGAHHSPDSGESAGGVRGTTYRSIPSRPRSFLHYPRRSVRRCGSIVHPRVQSLGGVLLEDRLRSVTRAFIRHNLHAGCTVRKSHQRPGQAGRPRREWNYQT